MILKQVKGFSSFLNNSAYYWKDTFNDFSKNLCPCGENEENNINADTNNNNNILNHTQGILFAKKLIYFLN